MLARLPPCPVPLSTKVCTKCKTEKALSEFYVRRTGTKAAECKNCSLDRNRTYRFRVREGTQTRRWSKFDPSATTKICPVCKIEKPFCDYAPDKTKRYGVAHSCKLCFRDYMSDRWRNNPEHRAKGKVRSEKNYSDVGSRAKILLNHAFKRRPQGFTLTLEHVENGIRAGTCPVMGIAFDLSNQHQKSFGRFRNPYSPSIDRIDSKLPYTNENCRVVITQYNIMKGELSDAEMFYLCRLIASRHPE